MNNKIKLIVITMLCIVVFLIGGTYAWYVWQTSNTEETIIATDTGYAKVYFNGGHNVIGKLKPVSDKLKGMSKEIKVSTDKKFIEDITFNLYLDINSLDEGLKHESFKFELYKDGQLVNSGNFGDSYLTNNLSECSKNEGVSHIVLTSDVVTTTESVYTLYTWIDGTMDNPLTMEGKNFDFTLHADGQHALYVDVLSHKNIVPEGATYIRGAIPGKLNSHDMTNAVTYTEGQPFPDTVEVGDIYQYGDYEYVYGCGYGHATSGWSPVTEYDPSGWGVRVLNDTKEAYGEILKSINNSNILFLYNTFYNCKNLISAPEIPNAVITMYCTFYFCENLVDAPTIPNLVVDMTATFMGCTDLVNVPNIGSSVTNLYQTYCLCDSLVNVPDIPDSVINMKQTFRACSSLVNAPEIGNSVVNMYGTFYDCTNLVNAPEIPDSAENIEHIFHGCTSLVTAPEIPKLVENMQSAFYNCKNLVNAPEIPDSVTNMQYTFRGCEKLEKAPEIPNSVIDMKQTFLDCTSLTSAPEIPDTVINMEATFYGCSKLTGDVKINSNNVDNFISTFAGTALPITVEVPENSTTYTNISKSGVVPSNVRITTFTKE